MVSTRGGGGPNGLVRLTAYLRSLPFGTVAVHLGSAPEHAWVREACRLADKHIVAADEAPDIVVTADGVVEEGHVRPLKDEVDAIAGDAQRVVVLRLVGDAPMAPTMDAYLDVVMREGRDVWFDDL